MLELSLAHTKTQSHHKGNIQRDIRLQVEWGKTLAERTSDKPQPEKFSHNHIKKKSHKEKQGIRTVDVLLCQTPFPDTSTMWLLSTCCLDADGSFTREVSLLLMSPCSSQFHQMLHIWWKLSIWKKTSPTEYCSLYLNCVLDSYTAC